MKRRRAGKVVSVAAISEDVTARKNAEDLEHRMLQELRSSEAEANRQKSLLQGIFQSAPDGIVLVDRQFNIIAANPSYAKMFGYEIEELLGHSTKRNYATPEKWPDINELGVVQRVSRRRKNGEDFPVDLIRAAVHNEQGDVSGYIGIFRDVSKQVKLEQALENNKRLEAIGRLTGGVAHDFNNLLTIIIGNLQLLQSQELKPQAKEFIGEAERAAHLGARLNQRLLTFARSRMLSAVLVDINSVVVDSLDLLARSLGESITIETDLSADIVTVKLDPAELENTLINLAVNARDAMPNGGALRLKTSRVSIQPSTAASEQVEFGEYVRVDIADTGIGMTADVASKAFEPFFTTKPAGRGSGLGLSSADGFARQSKGFITLDSQLGKGTTVSLFFPVAGEVAPPSAAPEKTSERSSTGQELVLVVEDNDAIRKLVLLVLARRACRCIAARTGSEALEILASQPAISLVFADVILPGGVSGYDIARFVRKNRPEMKILLTSGFSNEHVSGATPVMADLPMLHKPFTPDQLATEIDQVLA